jgi:hypothetical protein
MFYTSASTWSKMLKTGEIQPSDLLDVYQKRTQIVEKKNSGLFKLF